MESSQQIEGVTQGLIVKNKQNKQHSVYQPAEDSILLKKYVSQYATGCVLDIGTGSGIQSIAAAKKEDVNCVWATDVQKGVIEYCKKNIKNKKIIFIHSNLFKNLKKRTFDTIIFNPPYLPQELKIRDLTVEGGKKGYELIQEFLKEVNNFLTRDGIILMVFSSLTKKEEVENLIVNSMLEFKELEKTHIFFEDIFIYLLNKSSLLKKLEGKGITHVQYLRKGHRGLIFTGFLNGKKIAIKTKNPKSKAIDRIKNESRWLTRLNVYDIGVKLLFVDLADFDYLVYEYIEGKFILDYLKKSSKEDIKRILKKMFEQLFILDKLKVDKEEMQHPIKHIIITQAKPCLPFLIDFERANYSQKPKNVTQFCQFLTSSTLSEILKKKGIHIDKDRVIQIAKIYKNSQNRKNFKRLIDMFDW